MHVRCTCFTVIVFNEETIIVKNVLCMNCNLLVNISSVIL